MRERDKEESEAERERDRERAKKEIKQKKRRESKGEKWCGYRRPPNGSFMITDPGGTPLRGQRSQRPPAPLRGVQAPSAPSHNLRPPPTQSNS